MRIAITGATGSLGGALIERLKSDKLATGRHVEGVVALSRDEVKSGDFAERHADYAPLKCQLADVRDEARLEEVFRGCDVVVHAAALKRIGHSVYSPEEIVKTNVQGTINVVRAATEAGVGRVVVVSSDKACEATNLYGATKFVAECYAVQANSYTYPRGTRVSCVRYGNVLGSRGSVVGVWRDALREGRSLEVTDERMTRFVITLRQAAEFVLGAQARMHGGEVFVPHLPACRVVNLADAVVMDWYGCPATDARTLVQRHLVGLRPGGEKLHESLLGREEWTRTRWDTGGQYGTIWPSHHSWVEVLPVVGYPAQAPYASDEPRKWLGADDLALLLQSELPK